jgi:hypothetical protein
MIVQANSHQNWKSQVVDTGKDQTWQSIVSRERPEQEETLRAEGVSAG